MNGLIVSKTKPEDITKEFGMMISSIVFELTDNKEEITKLGKVEYQKAKWSGLSSYGLFIKLCDRLANVSDNSTDKYKKDTIDILSFIKNNRKLSKSQKSVIKEIENVINN